jgi:hypothetical protein
VTGHRAARSPCLPVRAEDALELVSGGHRCGAYAHRYAYKAPARCDRVGAVEWLVVEHSNGVEKIVGAYETRAEAEAHYDDLVAQDPQHEDALTIRGPSDESEEER